MKESKTKQPVARGFIVRFVLLLACTAMPWFALAEDAAPQHCETLPPSPACGATPSAVFADDGTLFVAYVHGEHVWLSRSHDAGRTYAATTRVNSEPEAIYADGENRPVLALDGNGDVFVAWTRQNDALYSGDIRFARSRDGGASFSAPITVNDDGLQTSHRFVSMQRTPGGQLYLAWLDKRDQVAAKAAGDDYTGAALYYTVSLDGGASFVPNRKVADQSCECCRIGMAVADAEQVAVFWRHVFEDGSVRDHALATLSPAAASQALRATEDDWRIDGCPHHGPALAADAGGYHLAWFTNGSKQQGVMYGYFDDAAGLTTRVHALDARPAGGHPALAVQGSQVSAVWKTFDGTRMTLQLAQSADEGRTWHATRTFAATDGASDHPLAVQHGSQTYIAWHTANEGLRLLPVPAVTEAAITEGTIIGPALSDDMISGLAATQGGQP